MVNPDEPRTQPHIPLDHIRLDHLLKREGLTDTGGHAKQAIQGGEVIVNGVVETRRKKKLRAGDTVSFGGRTVTVSL